MFKKFVFVIFLLFSVSLVACNGGGKTPTAQPSIDPTNTVPLVVTIVVQPDVQPTPFSGVEVTPTMASTPTAVSDAVTPTVQDIWFGHIARVGNAVFLFESPEVQELALARLEPFADGKYTNVRVLAREGNWAYVQLTDDPSVHGWGYMEYLLCQPSEGVWEPCLQVPQMPFPSVVDGMFDDLPHPGEPAVPVKLLDDKPAEVVEEPQEVSPAQMQGLELDRWVLNGVACIAGENVATVFMQGQGGSGKYTYTWTLNGETTSHQGGVDEPYTPEVTYEGGHQVVQIILYDLADQSTITSGLVLPNPCGH